MTERHSRAADGRFADALSVASRAAGLSDPDLLALARDGLTPQEAVADLKQRFPGAFKISVNAIIGAAPARPIPRKPVADMTAREVADFEHQVVAYDHRLTAFVAERNRLKGLTGEEP